MAFMTGVLGSVIPKLGELLKEEYDLQTGVRKKIERLSRDLESMHAALRKVGDMPPDQLDEQVKLWARNVREMSYDVEDILDTFLVHVDGREARDPNWFKHAAKKIVKLFRKTKARHQIADMVKIIDEQAKELAERRKLYEVHEIMANRAPSSTVDPRLEAMYKEVRELVGIEQPSEELISKLSLQGDESNKNTKTVSVVGVGGLGKTTLVNAVYNKLKVDFECTAFVPVGQNPDLKKVFRDILVDLDKSKYMDSKYLILDERKLIDELREYLGGKRYFIVIDDVWKAETWKTMKWAFLENNNGSRLITTTRINGVADQADEVYRLQPLSFEESRKLFYTRIFGGEGRCPDNKLDELSDKILKKCDGVPLAIIAMASLLLGKSRGQWIEVCNSIGFRDTVKILSLSYYDLPPHLKPCLLYLSAFPEDHFIDKNSLIWKWVAEGFVHKEERTGFLEVGERYFNELINRSLIMAVEVNMGIISCHLHDMVLDLLQQISQEENFLTIPDNDGTMTIPPSGRVRRLAHQNRAAEPTHHDRHLDPLGHLRSLIACNCDYKVLSLSRFKVLRVLALEDCKALEGFIHLESLLHLRYLGIRGTCIEKLPEGIGALKWLQTLAVEWAEELPSSIGQLTRLICLHLPPTTKVPNGVIENLTSLEDLAITFDDKAGHLVRELGNLRELRVLNFSFIVTATKLQSDFVESLGKLHKIQYLRGGGVLTTNGINQDLWDTLVLPRTLRYLDLPILSFRALPSCINPSALPHLSHLELDVKHMDEEAIEILGGLPELRHLKLWTRSAVTLTIHAAHGCFFQKLRTLSLPCTMVQFVPNEASSVSFTVGYGQHGVAVGTETREDAPAVMPNLEILDFEVRVKELIDENGSSCDNLGLECLLSLREVKVEFIDYKASPDDVARVEAAVRRATEVHPNKPTLQIYPLRLSAQGPLSPTSRPG